MKSNRNTYFILIQVLILILFFALTLLNEEFDLPHHLLGDPPDPPQHRHGEMVIEISFFVMVVVIYYFLNNNLLQKIKLYKQQKEILERTFFHDVHNTALALHGYAKLLFSKKPENIEAYKNVIYNTSLQLLEEIEVQRDVSYAEKDELPIHLQQLNSLEILSEIAELYKASNLSRNREIVIDNDAHDVTLSSDRTIIKRVLGNMVKNALEASAADESITLGCISTGDMVEFYVHNPNFIPKDVQGNIFKYSFSTKGKGRGLGTYCMKLLGEKYLKGKIVFHTSEEKGTTFKAHFPL